MADNLLPTKRDDVGRENPGEYDQDITQNDVDHATVPPELAPWVQVDGGTSVSIERRSS